MQADRSKDIVGSEETRNSITTGIREKGQYLLAFGVIASLLVVAKIPIFVVFFFGIFAYFLAKMLSNAGKNKTRSIFEFYLSAHEILRDDFRCWYGFEVREAIERGEAILRDMRTAPALVHFAVGALYHKIGDHSSAIKHLAYVTENPESFEANVVFPSSELRNYVTVLRKIERDPASAPLTSAAVRSLERARKMRSQKLLADCREFAAVTSVNRAELHAVNDGVSAEGEISERNSPGSVTDAIATIADVHYQEQSDGKHFSRINGKTRRENVRKPISELLHDIYDRGPH